ncbi:Phosphoribosylformimino-5-aminoimidazole carboxamide ribotide isomerase [Desulfurella amilsii]|uniref:1-(5-phosphoribosyl)-5-[(5-phosphoribosylamino)methylideneamino] imidazole-4-carboxamide isomerase n=1 Tax=Desulfurella amilsii TaxID=1562698 RepID=A0A1X4XVD3_9BACT|nr:1-(5-phosphoribosyl)-5-[(5-phosphoribosylamino)methylideneamino]imidazole-4-carboxamide isomerase [Desulfurella amilsii]OSS41490.1 Phosphoribosylformimino-5-aminoimidazole carboxamide ribotide isomerase [Desulfurella amilsii]
MLVIPAIDLMGSKVVRLTKGKADSAKTYSENPIEFALYFESLGFKRIHIVDLDAAFGKNDNFQTIQSIAKHTHIELEVGGGIRNFVTAQKLVDLGIKRLIIGSLPFKNKKEFENILKEFAEYIIMGIDVDNNRVKIYGWVEDTQVTCIDFLKQVERWGLKEAIVTDISKDGTLSGLDENFYGKIAQESKLNIIASGGIKSIDDIKRLKKFEQDGVLGVILGKAIYEGTIDPSKIKEGEL